MQLLHGIATLVAPALVAVLRQQLTAVSGESSVIRRDLPAAQRVLGQPLEFVGVDSDTLGVEGEHAVRQTEIRRILTSQQGRLQRATGDMNSLTEAIERRFRVHLRPEDVDDLFAVHRVSRLDGQKLDQGLGAPSRPIGYGLVGVAAFNAESSEQPHPQRRNPVRLGTPHLRGIYPRRRRMDVPACPGRNARDTINVTHRLPSADVEAWLGDAARVGLCAGRTNVTWTDGSCGGRLRSTPPRTRTVLMRATSVRREEEAPFRSSRRPPSQA